MSTSTPQPFSLVIITLDAAMHIEKCIASVPSAAEVIIVDSGSTDGTVDLAKSLNAKVISQPWLGFGPQKQFAVAQASNDWVLCLDADESLSVELEADVRLQLENPTRHCYQLARCNCFMGRELRHGGGYPDWNRRLFHRQHAQWSADMVHENVVFDGQPGKLSGDLMHDSAIELSTYLDKQNTYTSIQAQHMHSQGKKVGLSKLLLSPLMRFFKEYFLKLGFLDGKAGFVHICIASFFSMIKYAKLLELGKKQVTTP